MSHSPMPPLGEGRCVPELQNFDWNRFFISPVRLFPVNFWFLIRLAASRRKLLVSRKRMNLVFFTYLFPEHNGREYSFESSLNKSYEVSSSQLPDSKIN